MLLLLSTAGLALAQPQMPLGLPPGFDLSALQGPKAEARWLTAQVVATRFPGEKTPGPTFESGEMVELILEDGGQARVRQGDRYGWVPASALTTEAPAPPAVPASASDLLGAPPLLVPKSP
ncbi:MAG: hypothetical protein KC621_27440 [Myxococcales bacterium]|nr:hypothetical protein [Myxococcales bacterium]